MKQRKVVEELENGAVRTYYVPADDEKVVEQRAEAERLKEMARGLRIHRDDFLRLTDWTQLADAPLTREQKKEIKDYRAALRNVPQQKGFPQIVEWPNLPRFVKLPTTPRIS